MEFVLRHGTPDKALKIIGQLKQDQTTNFIVACGGADQGMSPSVKKLVESVEGGVCKSLDELIEESFPPGTLPTDDEYQQIDNNVFECQSCGWTLPTEEMSIDDDVCEECKDEED